ncbi:7-cyano-7-deazaguanine synthase QueC [Guyparkeria hydrothermalis]|uniref:7-cyano-7-deazaguanine synthase n=1 Tax=Guyparkeria halophila TaxID=47960 RepID=A0A6I6CYJ3_9GAMM|nr:MULTISPECIES: 7-cyano-7-deazaguanine synthase QueC [Guyparkeria]MCL7750721.1 7-cyano-7-deazaguanine synthase QueC [Guyparkeria hydrothermalis]QGT79289.1 7-cyano-7-deazaguanine synthase QueC [Guyparkeria halophila]TKA88446.1 7-cyano-7-deazaguanine synthase QueC [Guyparkeria sp. SB14A]
MSGSSNTPAVVLLSGGLDSATLAWQARADGYAVHALSFDYGQRHRVELEAADRVARAVGAAAHRTIRIDMGGGTGSSLTDIDQAVPDYAPGEAAIPSTYVPARNLTFLSFALGWAELLKATRIYIGVNAVDYSGYPDCRPAFIEKFQELANIATAADHPFEIHAPLLHLTKAEIIRTGQALGVDYGLTVSCYRADEQGRACGRCDSCHYRQQGFRDAGVTDPTRYA